MTLPVSGSREQLERLERRKRRRRQIRRRRATALVALAAVAGCSTWLAVVHGHATPRQTATPRLANLAGHATPDRHATPRQTRKAIGPRPLLTGPPALQSHRFTPALTARSAILVDASNGHVLYELRARVRRPVASTTKIMTALLALRRVPLNTLVTVDRTVPRVPLVKEGLRAGEQVRAWKLFYGMMLFSSNDAALALAIAAAGSRPPFISLMNDEARRLGLHDTHFRSPSGVVDVDNYSTAWDLAALTRVAVRNPKFRAIVRTRRRAVPWSAPTFGKVYVNKNLLLSRYPGANGVKTGYTTKAGHCLVASATRRGRTLVAVVLHSRDMYTDAQRLLDLGFATT